jgi:integrase
MANQIADASTPNTENFTVKRRYLTEREVERLMDTARKIGRHGHRDATMILVAYRHGFRASEVCSLEWHQIELDQGRLHVRRAKRGTPSVHPIRGDEIRALRRLRRENPTEAHVFVSEHAVRHPSAHASSRLRLQARQRRPRYSCSAALSRSQEYPAHSTLYRAKSRQIQGFLARLAKPTNHERQQGNTWGSYSMVSV